MSFRAPVFPSSTAGHHARTHATASVEPEAGPSNLNAKAQPKSRISSKASGRPRSKSTSSKSASKPKAVAKQRYTDTIRALHLALASVPEVLAPSSRPTSPTSPGPPALDPNADVPSSTCPHSAFPSPGSTSAPHTSELEKHVSALVSALSGDTACPRWGHVSSLLRVGCARGRFVFPSPTRVQAGEEERKAEVRTEGIPDDEDVWIAWEREREEARKAQPAQEREKEKEKAKAKEKEKKGQKVWEMLAEAYGPRGPEAEGSARTKPTAARAQAKEAALAASRAPAFDAHQRTSSVVPASVTELQPMPEAAKRASSLSLRPHAHAHLHAEAPANAAKAKMNAKSSPLTKSASAPVSGPAQITLSAVKEKVIKWQAAVSSEPLDEVEAEAEVDAQLRPSGPAPAEDVSMIEEDSLAGVLQKRRERLQAKEKTKEQVPVTLTKSHSGNSSIGFFPVVKRTSVASGMKPKAKGSGSSGPLQGASKLASSAADRTPPIPTSGNDAGVGAASAISSAGRGMPALSRDPPAALLARAASSSGPPAPLESAPQPRQPSRQPSLRPRSPSKEPDALDSHLNSGARELDPDAVTPHVASGDDREPTELSPHVPYGASVQTINKLSEMSYLPPSFPSHLETSTPLRDGSLDSLYRRKPSPIPHVVARLSSSPVERRSEEMQPVTSAPAPQDEESIPGLGAGMDGVVETSSKADPKVPTPGVSAGVPKASSKRPRSVTPPSHVRSNLSPPLPGDYSVAIGVSDSPGAAMLVRGRDGDGVDANKDERLTDYAPAAKKPKVQDTSGPHNANASANQDHNRQLNQIREYAQKHLQPHPVFPASSNTPPPSPPKTPVHHPQPVRAGASGLPAFGGDVARDPEEIPNSALPTLSELLASSRKAKVRPRPPSRSGNRTPSHSQSHSQGEDQAEDRDNRNGPDAPDDVMSMDPMHLLSGSDNHVDDGDERPHTPERENEDNPSPTKSYFSSPASGVSPGATTALPIRSPVSPMFAIGAADLSRDGGGFAPPFTSTQQEEYVPLRRAGSGAVGSGGIGRSNSGGFVMGGYSSQLQGDMEDQVERVSELLDRDVDFDGWLRDVVSASAEVDELRSQDSD